MELFKARTHVDFMSRRRIFLGISALLIVASVVVFFVRGLNSVSYTHLTLPTSDLV